MHKMVRLMLSQSERAVAENLFADGLTPNSVVLVSAAKGDSLLIGESFSYIAECEAEPVRT